MSGNRKKPSIWKTTRQRFLGIWFVWALVVPELVFGTAWAQEGAPGPPASTERASEPVCDPKDPTRCSAPLRTGDLAPFNGQLLSPDLAIDLGQKAELFDLRLDLELKRATGLLQADLSLERQLRENNRKAFEAQIVLLTTRLEEAHHRLWWEHPVFVAAVAVVLTGLVFYGSVEALKALE